MAFAFIKLDENLLADREKCVDYVTATVQSNVPRVVRTDREPFSFTVEKSLGEQLVSMALEGDLQQPRLASKETVEKQKALLSADLLMEFDKKTKCFLSSIIAVKEPIFQPGENLVSEPWFTYLEEPLENLPKGTAVFVRETNFSVHCFYIIGEIVDTSNKQQLITWKQPTLEVLGTFRIITIASKLGLGLLSGVAGKFAALIFNKIFPPGVPNYFTEVYKKIEEIVKEQLTQNVIFEINGGINGLQRWIKADYTFKKESGKYSKKYLTDRLLPKNDELAIKVLGVLMSNPYARPGICTFMIGAGMHLAMLQELAYVDPKSPPHSSEWVSSIKVYANQYAQHAKNTTTSILNKRKQMIVPTEFLWVPPGGAMMTNYLNWEDKHTGEKGAGWKYSWGQKGGPVGQEEAVQARNKDMNRHKEEAKQKLITEMNNPYQTADDWLKLNHKPLPH